MKRIQLNAIAPFISSFKEETGNDYFDFALELLNKALEGMEVKIVSRDEYNVVIEVNDKDNPIDTARFYDFLYEQLGIADHEGAFLSIYNYNPSFSFSSLSFGKGGLGNDLDKANKIREELNNVIIGQRHAVDVLINGYIKNQTFVSENNTKPAQTYLFCGPASSGKTSICEEFARISNMPVISFNTPDYVNGRQIGRLFSFVNKNPRGIIIFNEFEDFDGEFFPLVFNMLYTGKYSGVDFSKTIVFFTTTGGKKIYLDSGLSNFSSFSTEEIIRSLKEEYTKSGNPRYNPYLLDMLAKENVAMLNALDYYSIHQIIAAHIEKHAKNFTNKTGIFVDANYDELARFVLYCNPEETNLNVLKKNSENVLDEQVAYLAKNVEPNSGHTFLSIVKNIHIALPKKKKDEQVKKLFDVEPLDVLVVVDKDSGEFIKTLKVDNVNFVFARGKNEVLNKIKNGIDVVVLDPLYSIRGKTSVLDLEDVDSLGNDIFDTLIKYYHQLPLYLLSIKEYQIPQTAYQTLLLKGAKDVIYLEREHPETFISVLSKAIVNWDLLVDIKLLRKERLRLECNPVQQLVENKSGTTDVKVTLDNLVLSRGMSTDLDDEYGLRNVGGFNDVVGNSIAKEVLLKYGRYLSNPHKYLQEGLSVPKGLLIRSGWHNLGKSTLINALSKEVGCKLIKLDVKKTLMESSSIDQIADRFKEAFKKARRNAPAILHVTDINLAITLGDNAVNSTLLPLLRNEIAYSINDVAHPILLIAEANCDAPLTLALKDLGLRFILLEIPTVAEKEEFIRRYFDKHHIENISAQAIHSFAVRCFYEDYVQLNNILDFAVQYAQGKDLTDKILADSLDVHSYGDVSIREHDDETILATSYHEMGHYLTMRLFGQKSPFVTVVPRGYYNGYTSVEFKDNYEKTNKQYFLNDICCSLAGRAAEVVSCGETNGINSGISGDIKNATQTALLMITKCAMGEDNLAFIPDNDISSKNPLIYNEVNRILKEQYARALRLLELNRKSLDILAKALFEKKSIIGAECEELVPDSELVYE